MTVTHRVWKIKVHEYLKIAIFAKKIWYENFPQFTIEFFIHWWFLKSLKWLYLFKGNYCNFKIKCNLNVDLCFLLCVQVVVNGADLFIMVLIIITTWYRMIETYPYAKKIICLLVCGFLWVLIFYLHSWFD